MNESKYEQERLSRELTEMKRKYYLQKRKEKIVEDMEYEAGGNVSMSKSGPISIHQEQTAAAKNARIRYTGGGYAINWVLHTIQRNNSRERRWRKQMQNGPFVQYAIIFFQRKFILIKKEV